MKLIQPIYIWLLTISLALAFALWWAMEVHRQWRTKVFLCRYQKGTGSLTTKLSLLNRPAEFHCRFNREEYSNSRWYTIFSSTLRKTMLPANMKMYHILSVISTLLLKQFWSSMIHSDTPTSWAWQKVRKPELNRAFSGVINGDSNNIL